MLVRHCEVVTWPARRGALAAAAFAGTLFASLCFLALPGLSQTKTYCSEPVRPFCIDQTGVFEDATAEERCRIEVDKYVEGMEEHADCLGEQQKEVRERAAEIEEHFACMARGETDC